MTGAAWWAAGPGGPQAQPHAAALGPSGAADGSWNVVRYGPENLYIGDVRAEMSIETLTTLGITHIVQVTNVKAPSHPGRLSYLHIHIDDTPLENIAQYFGLACEFIEEAHRKKGKVLVHCMAGMSRSCTICAAWLMWKFKVSADDALHHMKIARSIVSPNEGFVSQLRAFDPRTVKFVKDGGSLPSAVKVEERAPKCWFLFSR